MHSGSIQTNEFLQNGVRENWDLFWIWKCCKNKFFENLFKKDNSYVMKNNKACFNEDWVFTEERNAFFVIETHLPSTSTVAKRSLQLLHTKVFFSLNDPNYDYVILVILNDLQTQIFLSATNMVPQTGLHYTYSK